METNKSFYENVICITNRHLVKGDFYKHMEKVFSMRPKAVIVREKDMNEKEYDILAGKLLNMGKEYGVAVYLNTFYNVALKYGCDSIHLPFGLLEELSSTEEGKKILSSFRWIGTAVHSLEQLKLAEKLDVEYVIAGHIFKTDCKKDVPPRGINFLKEICNNTDLPVYAIGGINLDNMKLCFEAGADSVCMMSEFAK